MIKQASHIVRRYLEAIIFRGLFNAHNSRQQVYLLLFWTFLGLGLRLLNLDLKAPWSDEWSTLVFSLGHGFSRIPRDQLISSQQLLQPLQLAPDWHFRDVVRSLYSESNHPPLYFLLTHAWLQVLSPSTGLVSVWLGRLLSACLGTLCIPLTFGVTWQMTRHQRVAGLAAALMAVSPFAVYLSQEARHYTFSIIWVLLSLLCFSRALRAVHDRQPLPVAWAISWIVVNGLGVATHFFFNAMIAGEAIALAVWGFAQAKLKPWQWQWLWSAASRRLLWVSLGTAVSSGIWLLNRSHLTGSHLTDWLARQDVLEPPVRLAAAWLTMMILLPIENVPEWVVSVSGSLLILFTIAATVLTTRGLAAQLQRLQLGQIAQALLSLLLAVLALFGLAIYGLNQDLSLAPRYQFVYFPLVIMLSAIALATQRQQPWGRGLIAATLVLGILGSLSVTANLAYQKSEQGDHLLAAVQTVQAQQQLPAPTIVASTYLDHGDTGKLMNVAWALHQLRPQPQSQPQLQPQSQPDLSNSEQQYKFLLLEHQPETRVATEKLHQQLATLPRPLTLWMLNFFAPHEADQAGCEALPAEQQPDAAGYWSLLYYCP
ncbi:MAG: glycosyltransferase family 39 protein [Cyanobacteria bacterium P01_H01_bin.121]